jgi:hypothetical protein
MKGNYFYMKNFILDSTYKDVTIINSNDDISIVSLNSLRLNSIPHNYVHISETAINHAIDYNKNSRLNNYSVIDYL